MPKTVPLTRGPLLTEGTTKRLYETAQPDAAILEFTDRPTACQPSAPAVPGKGAWNAKISARLFQLLESKGVNTHFEAVVSEAELLVKRLNMIPLAVVIRNRAAGRLAKRLGLEPWSALANPVVELRYRSAALEDPWVNESHVLALRLATEEELKVIRERSSSILAVLTKFFQERDLDLIDLTLEFGRFRGRVVLGDELSPDTIRLWERGVPLPTDADLFLQRDLRGTRQAYQEVGRRVLETAWASSKKP